MTDRVAARRHLVLVGASAAGLALAPASFEWALAAGAILAAALAGARLPLIGLGAACLLTGGFLAGAARLSAIDGVAAKARPGVYLDARAELLERPRGSPFGSSAPLRIVSGQARGARVLARVPLDIRWPAGGEPGSVLAVTGLLRRPRSPPRAEFDFPAHLRRRGIATELLVDRLRPTGRRRGGVASAVDAMRRRAERALASGLSPPDGALARGMVLGQDEAIPAAVRDDFRDSGLGHLLAVSGQNVMLLCALALPLLVAAGLGVRGRVAGLLALIAVYVPLAGAGPSLQRAAVMGAAGLAALALSRPASRWYALSLAAVVTLALNPRVAGDPGWQLSFAAVAGILVLAPPLRRRLTRLPRPLAEGVAMTVAASVATAPLAAHHFGSVPLAGLAANLAALPAVAPVMWIGMLDAGAAQLGATGVPLEWVGAVNGLLLGYLRAVARRFAEAPGSQLALPLGSGWAVAATYALLAGAAVGALALRARLAAVLDSTAVRWRLLRPQSRTAIAASVAALAALLALRAVAPPGPPGALTVRFLDVGQGDATLIQHPDGSALLFDGGPEQARVARLLRSAGVRRLSAVVATHASADHHGGLREVIERFPVGLLLDGGDGTADRDFRALLAEADRRGIRRLPARAGQSLRAGSLRVNVLSPPSRPPGPAPSDPNLRAVTTVVSVGSFDLFLSADAESPALEGLDLPDVDAMKVPHHGSRDPGLPAVLRRLRPEVAAIEVGEHNRYGHPAPETLAALGEAVPRNYRTDRDGTVTLTVEGGRMHVSTAP